MAAHADARIDEHDGVITVSFQRDAKRNAISPAMTDALWEAVIALGDRDDLRCLVITATGSYFSAGIDLEFGAGNRRGTGTSTQPGWAYRRNYRSHHLLYDEIEAVEKPVILAAQGPVLGAGFELALSCDFRLCTPAATWRLPEVGLGAIPGSGGISRLSRLVGPHWTKWIAMAGQSVTAEDARQMGLVHEVCEIDALGGRVDELCSDLCALGAEALGVAKATIDLATDVTDRASQRSIERMANTTLRVGNDEFLARTQRFRAGTITEDRT